MKSMPKVSVIIPSYNRGDIVAKTIDSFINQSFNDYEIIVVDNNSTDNTREVIEKMIKLSPVKIKYILEERQGVHWARNRGAKEANSDILYFTDDDMEADKNLLEEIIKVFDVDSSIGAVTGTILPKFEIKPPEWVMKYCYNAIYGVNVRKGLVISDDDVGVFSGHEAVKKDVLIKAGGFNPENTKGKWLGDGETGFNQNIKKLGYKFAFTDRSITYHLIPKERLSQRFINLRMANQGNADSYTYYRSNPKWPFFQIFKHILKGMYFLGLAVWFFIVRNSEWRLRWAWGYYWIARIKYDFKLSINKEWRELVLKSNWISEI